MINEVTVTLTVPADRLADLQAFCMEQEIVAATPAAAKAEPKKAEPKKTEPKKSRKKAAAKKAEPKKAEPTDETNPVATIDTIRDLLAQSVVASKQTDALAILSKHGAPTLPELTEDKFEAVAADLKELLA